MDFSVKILFWRKIWKRLVKNVSRVKKWSRKEIWTVWWFIIILIPKGWSKWKIDTPRFRYVYPMTVIKYLANVTVTKNNNCIYLLELKYFQIPKLPISPRQHHSNKVKNISGLKKFVISFLPTIWFPAMLSASMRVPARIKSNFKILR